MIKNPFSAEEQSVGTSYPEADLLGKTIAPDVLREIPEEAAIFYQFIPFNRKGNVLEVAMVEPDDLKAREALRFIVVQSKSNARIYKVDSASFLEAVKQYRTLKKEVASALEELEQQLKEHSENFSEEAMEKSIVEAPISKIVSNILRHAQEGRASDVHIEPVEKEVRVRFRVDGVLYTSIRLPKKTHSAIISRIKILSGMKIDESRVPQDGRFYLYIDDVKIDFRVSVLPTAHGEKVAMRLLDPSVGLMGFEALGLSGRNLGILQEGIAKPFGMVLLTGPTGSGKTTTLYAILNTLNVEGVNIISLEDPVEYFIEGINQSQIRPEINYSFASGLRSILRQDPDIIMVGEIRDEETASLSVHAALTGHLVLSTLHTNDAIGVIPRLLDMKVRR
jgi:type IV pilus assembly protein PilB